MKTQIFIANFVLLFFVLNIAAFKTTAVCSNDAVIITGQITYSNGDPVPECTISVKGTTTGTVTDTDGNFSIQAESGDTLVFSFVGCESQEVVVTQTTTVNITIDCSEEI